MAKENKHSPVFLFVLCAVLCTAGWLMAAFPIFIFFGMAPLFALTDRVEDSSSVWEKMEWVLLSLTVSFLAARLFDFSTLVSSLILAILFTLSFMGHVWVRQTLGQRVGKITIVLFWLSLEYLLLKVNPGGGVYLADSIRLQPDWMRWNIHTGFLGASLWILLTNLLIYQAFLSTRPFQWYWILLSILALSGPIVFSYSIDMQPVSRELMLDLYSKNQMVTDVNYLARGEFVVRTAAWISTLILLFTLIKNRTHKR
jgi:apolipoprotein N-acyltransferase